MARGTQLLQLVAQLRAETGRSMDVSAGVSELDGLKEQIRRVQKEKYEEYDWPHMIVERSVNLQAGQRYYDLPEDLNFDRITQIKYKYNNNYTDIDRGIDFSDYSIYDSNNDERSSLIMKWDIRNIEGTEQIEVWPIPNTNDQKLYFLGVKTLNPLIEESDRAELDDTLIVINAAAEMLSSMKGQGMQRGRLIYRAWFEKSNKVIPAVVSAINTVATDFNKKTQLRKAA